MAMNMRPPGCHWLDCYSLEKLSVLFVGYQAHGGKAVNEEVVLPVVGGAVFLPLGKHNKLEWWDVEGDWCVCVGGGGGEY